MKPLTQKQADVLAFIKKSIKQNSISPTRTEIAKEFGFHPNAAQDHVNRLIKKGAITQTEGKMRSILPVKGYRVRVK